jgi:hypothetical protein
MRTHLLNSKFIIDSLETNHGHFPYAFLFFSCIANRFEALNLSFKNMCKLKPLLQRWLQDADAGLTPASMAAAAGATVSNASLAQTNGVVLNSTNGTSGVNGIAMNGNGSVGARMVGAGNNSQNAGNNSALQSAAALLHSPMLSSNEAMCKRRKKRTSIDAHIRLSLENAFTYNQKPSLEEISSLAEKIKMDKEVVSIF